MAAHVARDQDHGRDRTVREFISEFRGLSGSAKQKRVLEESGTARTSLADLSRQWRGGHSGRHCSPLGGDAAPHPAAQAEGSRRDRPRSPARPFHARRRATRRPSATRASLARPRKACRSSSRRRSAGVRKARAVAASSPAPTGRVALGNPFRSISGARAKDWKGCSPSSAPRRAEPIVFVVHLASPRIAVQRPRQDRADPSGSRPMTTKPIDIAASIIGAVAGRHQGLGEAAQGRGARPQPRACAATTVWCATTASRFATPPGRSWTRPMRRPPTMAACRRGRGRSCMPRGRRSWR